MNTSISHKNVESEALRIVGLKQRYSSSEGPTEIPKLWQQFVPHIAQIPGRKGIVTYGVMFEMGRDSFWYMAGVEVEPGHDAPEGLALLEIPSHRYATFPHEGHISTLCVTIDSIWNEWLPACGMKPFQPELMFERYGEGFDPIAGEGDLDIWLAIQ